jgi:signal peptidase I
VTNEAEGDGRVTSTGSHRPGETDGSGSVAAAAPGPAAADITALPPEGSGSTKRSKKEKRNLPLWQEVIVLLVMALGLAIVIKTFFVQAFYIPSGSMDQTLVKNDRILVEKTSYWFGDVERGDIIVFDDPGNWLNAAESTHPSNPVSRGLEFVGLYPAGGHLVKRVIGVGGDKVRCCDKFGRITVNGVPLDEHSYLDGNDAPSDTRFNVTVPPDHLWVMGDNRNDSADSRSHLGGPGGGFVPTSDVVGKVFTVVWPLSDATWLSRPATFDNAALDKASAVGTITAPYAMGLAAAPSMLALWRRRRYRPTGDV